MSSRRYSEKEVAAILQRAAELQVDAPGQRSVSLDELERIAEEAGMDAALVRRAADEVARAESAATPGWLRRLLGGPSKLKWELEVPGEIDESAHERILEAIHVSLSDAGIVNTTGRTLTWTISNQTRNFSITVTPRGGNTVIRVEDRLGNLIGGIYGGVLGGVGGSVAPFIGIAGGTLLGPVGAVGGVVLGVAGAYGLTRAIYARVTGKREAALERLAAELRAAVEESVAKKDGPADEVTAPATSSALAEARARHGLHAAPDDGDVDVATIGIEREEEA